MNNKRLNAVQNLWIKDPRYSDMIDRFCYGGCGILAIAIIDHLKEKVGSTTWNWGGISTHTIILCEDDILAIDARGIEDFDSKENSHLEYLSDYEREHVWTEEIDLDTDADSFYDITTHYNESPDDGYEDTDKQLMDMVQCVSDMWDLIHSDMDLSEYNNLQEYQEKVLTTV